MLENSNATIENVRNLKNSRPCTSEKRPATAFSTISNISKKNTLFFKQMKENENANKNFDEVFLDKNVEILFLLLFINGFYRK